MRRAPPSRDITFFPPANVCEKPKLGQYVLQGLSSLRDWQGLLHRCMWSLCRPLLEGEGSSLPINLLVSSSAIKATIARLDTVGDLEKRSRDERGLPKLC